VGNPCKLVDKRRSPSAATEIRFLDEAELEALLREVPDDPLGRVERVLYLTAAMTGLRQGELLALRWRDVDWMASRLRVRRNFVRGEFGTPKSRRSSRSVPLVDRVSVELDLLHRETHYGGDDDLVFCHPHLGKPVDRSKLLKRFKSAARRAALRDVRFHDLRHTFGTRVAAAGVPMRALQEWMGHRDFKTMRRARRSVSSWSGPSADNRHPLRRTLRTKRDLDGSRDDEDQLGELGRERSALPSARLRRSHRGSETLVPTFLPVATDVRQPRRRQGLATRHVQDFFSEQG
jgi:integrase